MRSRHGVLVAVTIAVLAALVPATSAVSQSDPAPETLTLTPPAGYTEVQAGAVGEEFFEDFPSDQRDALREAYDNGYQRTWLHENQQSVVTSVVIAFNEPIDRSQWFDGVEEEAQKTGGTLFEAPSVPDSQGFSGTEDAGDGQQLHYHQVAFIKKNHAFFDVIGSLGQPLHSTGEAEALAKAHYEALGQLPAAEDVADVNTGALVVAGVVVLAVVLGVLFLIVFLVRRGRKSSTTAVAPPLDGVNVGAPTGTAGWHPDPYGRHELRWYDGEGWTDSVNDAGATSRDPVEVAPPSA